MRRAYSTPPRVLITGASSGLGAALAARYARAGARVLMADITEPANAPANATFHRLDVTSTADWAAAVDRVRDELGGLDLLVNNAGIAAGGRIDQLDEAHWRRALEVNLLGAVNGCRAFVPMLKTQGGGHLVNVASLAGLVHPAAMSSYAASKAAVVALSESLRFELKPWGITVSVVCPSFFRSNLTSSLDDTDALARRMAVNLIDRAPHDADQIAARVVAAVERGRFLVLPDRRARSAYWTKRCAPKILNRQMFAAGAAISRAERTRAQETKA